VLSQSGFYSQNDLRLHFGLAVGPRVWSASRPAGQKQIKPLEYTGAGPVILIKCP